MDSGPGVWPPGVLIARKGEPFPGGKGELADKHIILTAAHVVANSTFIQVQLSDSPERHLAHVYQVRWWRGSEPTAPSCCGVCQRR